MFVRRPSGTKLLVIGVLALAATNCYAALPSGLELPSESELPGMPGVPNIQLPSESELPQAYQLAQNTESEGLPAENLLPPDTDAAAPDPAGPLPLAGSPDGIPWLRLNLRGHTAPVRAIKFTAEGDRLCTAGDDKSVIVWLHNPQTNHRQYERTIRWQVQRGTRGRVYALAAAPGLLAIGGEGAMGGTGEIVLVDPATGDFVATLFDEQNGHRQVVVALDFVETPDGPALASESMDGRTLLWTKNEQGLWRARVVLPDDRAADVDPQLAEQLLRNRVFSGVVALDDHRVIVPIYQTTEKNQLAWRLEVVDATNGSRTPLGGNASPRHWNSVTALATDAARSRLVSADAAGRVYLWDLKANPATVRPLNRPQPTQALSLSLSPDGKTLAIGTAASGGVEIWDLADARSPRLKVKLPAEQHVLATAIDKDGDVAYANDSAVIVSSAVANAPRQALRGTVNVPLRVAFSIKEPLYRIGIGTQTGDQGSVPINAVFDTDQLRFSRTDQLDESTWFHTENSNWRVVEVADEGQGRAWYVGSPGTELEFAL